MAIILYLKKIGIDLQVEPHGKCAHEDSKEGMMRQEDLFYFVFGISVDEAMKEPDSLKRCVEKCAHKAYLDLCRTMRYKDKKDANRDDCVNNVNSNIVASILDLHHPSESYFDDWHKKTVECIQKEMPNKYFKEGEAFTVGQAQKWINMTIRYLWIMGADIDIDILKAAHVPLDSYILSAVRTAKDEIICDGYRAHGLGISEEKTKFSWSKILKYSDYMVIQSEIRKNTKEYDYPLQWETQAWMAEATQRSR